MSLPALDISGYGKEKFVSVSLLFLIDFLWASPLLPPPDYSLISHIVTFPLSGCISPYRNPPGYTLGGLWIHIMQSRGVGGGGGTIHTERRRKKKI